jgi:hypothetical protein
MDKFKLHENINVYEVTYKLIVSGEMEISKKKTTGVLITKISEICHDIFSSPY